MPTKPWPTMRGAAPLKPTQQRSDATPGRSEDLSRRTLEPVNSGGAALHLSASLFCGPVPRLRCNLDAFPRDCKVGAEATPHIAAKGAKGPVRAVAKPVQPSPSWAYSALIERATMGL